MHLEAPGLAPGLQEAWPALPYEAWQDTCETVHLFTQVVGMVRMELSPPVNHWWHVALYLTSRGLTTSPIPYGGASLDLTFDFVADRLLFEVSDGRQAAVPLRPMPVAEFHRRVLGELAALGVEVKLPRGPAEVLHPIPFAEDDVHRSYDGDWVRRFWRTLLRTSAVLAGLRGQFLGKASPIHFFWGSFDLALTYFSGRRAPERPELDAIGREAYSHEVISFGFWPGGETFPKPAYYAYAAPVPPALATVRCDPPEAYWHPPLGEFLLEHEQLRQADDPARALRRFYLSAYEAAADAAGWDRERLERGAASLH
ncbi:DUF5996 family protein [Anaeromyxobacter diazotrophicus]|uniref:Ava_C0101 and related proteins n=1 Tax=Anaeromyxobacter diazotrophicus TaxID=2590199 RepID=A0A7I9VM75_9BACT|nr:DUF5996 family protein [Anaeromyxobacter diazotrophicus]GEJ57505.1 hypothetical protein AMYX_22460 [Anaeromyxobacter diazotrophicus]